MQPLSGKVRVECQKLRVFCDVCDFFWSGAPLSGNPAVECQKLRVFCDFFLVGCTPLGKRGSSVKNETVLKTVLTIRFASYGRFFKRGKMSENRQKTSKTGVFLRFFRVRSNPLRESGCQVSKTGFFLRFFFGRAHLSQGKQGSSVKNWGFFAFLGVPKLSWKLCSRFVLPHTAVFWPLPKVKKGGFRLVWNQSETDLVVSDWFQTTLKLEGSETICFSIHSHPEPSSDGFRGVSEWFQSGPKLCGFRGVPEWSETVWFQRGFRVVLNRVVSKCENSNWILVTRRSSYRAPNGSAASWKFETKPPKVHGFTAHNSDLFTHTEDETKVTCLSYFVGCKWLSWSSCMHVSSLK